MDEQAHEREQQLWGQQGDWHGKVPIIGVWTDPEDADLQAAQGQLRIRKSHLDSFSTFPQLHEVGEKPSMPQPRPAHQLSSVSRANSGRVNSLRKHVHRQQNGVTAFVRAIRKSTLEMDWDLQLHVYIL